ncbi:MAG: PKD domain-containing protein, partial [Flavobacteriales bacterium]|nr:PKD domain-containing protein [Flavobacteriales bacterium]
MSTLLKPFLILFLLFGSAAWQVLFAQCEVDAGENQTICLGESVVLGGNPTVVEGVNPELDWSNGLGDVDNPTVSPVTTTTYTVELEADDCDDTDQITITVLNNPVASFNVVQNDPCSSEEVLFINTSSGSDLTYQWDFGNPGSEGNTSSDQNPSHEFLAPGDGADAFTVTLTVTDDNGCSSTTSQTVNVTESPDATIADVDIFTPFVMCGPPGTLFDISINNTSTTQATNTSYVVDWGDGTAPFTGATWASLDHSYAETGFFDLSVTVIGQNGCVSTEVYDVFVGNNPSVALGGGNTIGLCAPTETLSFPILNTQNNPPGTIYTVSYNDGSPNEIFTHPPPPAVEHVFNGSSCGVTSLGGFANSFHVRIIASNPCGQSSSTFEPVQTSSPPTVSMDVLPGNEWCSNTPSFQFVNTSTNAFFNNNGVCSNLMTAQWSILPATGWTITGGTLNDANGFSASFDPGTYTVTMVGSNPCGSQTVSQEICATPPPES